MKKNKEKIAIIGSGIFGCTLALVLSKKYDVSIFEIKNDIQLRENFQIYLSDF